MNLQEIKDQELKTQSEHYHYRQVIYRLLSPHLPAGLIEHLRDALDEYYSPQYRKFEYQRSLVKDEAER